LLIYSKIIGLISTLRKTAGGACKSFEKRTETDPGSASEGQIECQQKKEPAQFLKPWRLNTARSKTPNDTYRDALLGWELMVAGSLPLTRNKIGGL
jgi:hypothetical protein